MYLINRIKNSRDNRRAQWLIPKALRPEMKRIQRKEGKRIKEVMNLIWETGNYCEAIGVILLFQGTRSDSEKPTPGAHPNRFNSLVLPHHQHHHQIMFSRRKQKSLQT